MEIKRKKKTNLRYLSISNSIIFTPFENINANKQQRNKKQTEPRLCVHTILDCCSSKILCCKQHFKVVELVRRIKSKKLSGFSAIRHCKNVRIYSVQGIGWLRIERISEYLAQPISEMNATIESKMPTRKMYKAPLLSLMLSAKTSCFS